MSEMKCKRCGEGEDRIHGYCSVYCQDMHYREQAIATVKAKLTEMEAKLAEAESKVVLTRAEADGAESLLLDVQADCISEKQRADKLEAACAAYREALEIEACETRMRIGRVGEDCDDHLCPLESGDCYGRWAADALKANPAGAAMLEVWKAAEEFRDWADGVTSAKNKQTWTQAVMAFFKGDVPNTFHELNRHLRSICEKVRDRKGGE